jgi:hypothetical protein
MSVATPGTENPNNVWAPTSRGGQYVKQPYLVVSKDCHIKQKTILGSKYIPSIQDTETGFLSVNGEVVTPGTVVPAITATATLTGIQLVSGLLVCNPAAAITLTIPTGATISTFIRSKFGGIILPGFGFDLRFKNVATTSTDTVTIAVSGITGILSIGSNLTIGSAADMTFTFIYAGNLAGVETWACY